MNNDRIEYDDYRIAGVRWLCGYLNFQWITPIQCSVFTVQCIRRVGSIKHFIFIYFSHEIAGTTTTKPYVPYGLFSIYPRSVTLKKVFVFFYSCTCGVCCLLVNGHGVHGCVHSNAVLGTFAHRCRAMRRERKN